jgi:hypothetical protein
MTCGIRASAMAGFRDPDGNAILVHHRYMPCEQT